MSLYILPNYIGNEIDRKLDAAIQDAPAAEKDREFLRGQLIEYFAEHGVVPESTLAKARDQ